jgi:hypothetical protein
LGIGEDGFELVCCKKIELVGAGKGGSLDRGTGPAAAIEKPSGPPTARVARNIGRQVLSAHRVTTKLTA